MFQIKKALNKATNFFLIRFNHSLSQTIYQKNMIIHLLPALEDNYMYLLEDTATKQVAVVDPVDADKVIEKVKELNLKLTKVLTTHHHWDHAGGNADLINKFKETKLEVFGGDERIAGLTRTVKHDDLIKLGNLDIRCISTPCHTTGHICYYVEKSGFDIDPCVFTGDTLFVGGCGKFFEGTADQMCDALINKLSKLPDKTRVYCGHEYTVGNLKFAKSVEPNNQNVLEKLKWAEEQRSKKEPTIPSTIGEEKSYNPFMRVNEETIKKAANHFEINNIMKNLRQMKNNFS